MPARKHKILIVDDDKVTRLNLQRMLETETSATVLAAADGEEAWREFQANRDVQFIISDWLMPSCDGLELCRRVRGLENRSYTYLILATSTTQREDVVRGINAGADDFIHKPVDPHELLARVRSGLRVLNLEKKLAAHNAELEKGLAAAQQVQLATLPTPDMLDKIREFNGLNIAYRYRASQGLGGDILGVAQPEADIAVVFLGDVAGHGIPSSLSAVSLHNYLQTCLHKTHEPAEVMRLANEFCADTLPEDVYATMVFLRWRAAERTVDALIAGHPPLLQLAADGQVLKHTAALSGLGLWPDAPAARDVLHLPLGREERLIAYTDGVIEARNEQREIFDEDRLLAAMTEARGAALEDLPDQVLAAVARWRGTINALQDDITLVALQHAPSTS